LLPQNKLKSSCYCYVFLRKKKEIRNESKRAKENEEQMSEIEEKKKGTSPYSILPMYEE